MTTAREEPERSHPAWAGQPILVTGAAGFIGRDLVAFLQERGHRVRALVRPGRAGDLASSDQLEMVTGDLRDRDSLVAAVAGVSAVVHLAARKADEPDSRDVNVEGARRLVEACRLHRVGRVVNVSTQSAKLRRVGTYGATKLEAEGILHASGLAVTTLRPSVVYGQDRTGVFARMRHYLERLPVVPVIGDGRWRSRPIHVRDVSAAVLGCLERPATAGQIYDLGGPDDVTMDAFLDAIGDAIGARRRKLHVPAAVGLLGARVLARVTPTPPLTVSNVLGSTQDTDCDPAPAVAELAIRPVGLVEGLERVLDDEVRRRHGAGPGPVLRVAVVGLGKMGLFHAALLQTLPSARLVGLVDADPTLASSARSMGLTAPFFRSIDELLARRPVQAAFVCTPTFAHYAGVRACLECGVSVFVEKPLAEDAARAAELAELAARAGVVHAVGYHLASSPIFEHARQLLADGVLGPLGGFRSTLAHGEVLGPKRGWMFDRAKAGGGLVRNTASHLVHLLERYFGTPVAVSAKTGMVHSVEIEDTVDATLEYPSGMTGTIEASWSVPGKPVMEVAVEVWGVAGSLRVDGTNIVLDLQAPGAGFAAGRHRLHASDLPSEGIYDLAPDAYGAAYFIQDRAFVHACLAGGAVRTPFAGAVRAEHVIDAIYRSAARSTVVAVEVGLPDA